MSLASRKYNFIQEIFDLEDDVFDKLEKVLKAYKKRHDWSLELSEEERSEIEIGLKEANDNQGISHEEIMKQFSKWH